MLEVGEMEEAFFDTAEQFTSDYDIWSMEPQSVRERRDNFLSRMGFQTTALQSEVIMMELDMDMDSLVLQRRNSNSEATNCSFDYSDEELEVNGMEQVEEHNLRDSPTAIDKQMKKKKKKKLMNWLRRSFSKKHHSLEKSTTIRMQQKHKKYIECTGVYCEQQIKAHNGLIWTMKFSPDGQYLASGGEDGVVCIRRVTYENTNTNRSNLDKIFHLQEETVHKFKAHSSDVLDIAWSTSNYLLSTSTDKTVRLWHVDSDKCLGVFHHSNYVTCVQFNPVDERYFISGSIDGKVRVWGISSGRVEEWANVGDDIVTAVCYQPNGKGFVVGTLSGNCRFYESSGDELLLNAEIDIRGKKKSSANKITGIQFLNNDSGRLMITSEDSKIRILDGLEVVRKYKGLTKSGSQMCASFTSSGRHIVSLGEDSRIYIWNYDDMCIQTPAKHPKSTRSCEHFISEGVSVVLPWQDINLEHNNHACSCCTSPPTKWDSERFSLANWFSGDRATWPEEKLPHWDMLSPDQHSRIHQESMTWGLVFVTANWDGTIRTFHNYGLPVKV